MNALDITVEAAEPKTFSDLGSSFSQYEALDFYDDHLCKITRVCGETIGLATTFSIQEDITNPITMTS